MKLPSSYVPLILALIFSLVIGLLPTTPVLGNNGSVCRGNQNSNSSLILGGRIITPSLILQAGLDGEIPCSPGETALSILSLSRTIVVSPVGTPSSNGTALLNAMSIISAATPTTTDPWLLKLEPGTYPFTG